MKFEIKSWINNSVLFSTEADSFRSAIESAIKSEANLSGANLSRANLSGADLYRANLYGANLYGADLYGANLYGARWLKAEFTSLRMLLDQPGKIRAYKLVDQKNEGPFDGGLIYEVGKKYEAKADTDEKNRCGEGINLADLPWCLKEWKPGYKILIAEFTAKDIAAIPLGTDGKFRVHRCKIVGEKKLDYAALGFIKQ